MTSTNGEWEGECRASIGSIRIRWRVPHSILFVSQALSGMAFVVWMELAWATADSPVDTTKAIIWGIAVVGAAALATTTTSAEALELMLGTRDLINDWIKKRHKAAEARGAERGAQQSLSRARDWYNRQQAAREKGEPFNEPPPWDDK